MRGWRQACQLTEIWMETSVNALTILLKWVSMGVGNYGTQTALTKLAER